MKETKVQALFNTIGNSVYLAALWFLSVITTQVLGYKDVGDLTLAMTIGNIVILLQLYGVRGIQSSDMDFKYSPSLYLKSRLFTVSIGILIGISISVLLGYSQEQVIAIFLFIMFKSSEAISDVFYGDDQRMGKLELAGYSLFLRGLVTGSLFLFGLYHFKNLNISLLLIVGSGFILTLLIDYPIYKKTIVNFESTSGKIVDILKECFPLLITTLIPAIITAVPRVVLAYWHGTEQLGYYGNLSTPALVLVTFVPNFLIAFLPQYGKMFISSDYRGIIKLWYKSLFGTLLLSCIFLFGVFLVGRIVLTFLYTNMILPYVHFLYYVIIVMGIYSMEICCATVLVAMRERKILTIAALYSLIACLIVSVPLVKSYGISGAIAVLAISYSIQVIIQVLCIVRVCTVQKAL